MECTKFDRQWVLRVLEEGEHSSNPHHGILRRPSNLRCQRVVAVNLAGNTASERCGESTVLLDLVLEVCQTLKSPPVLTLRRASAKLGAVLLAPTWPDLAPELLTTQRVRAVCRQILSAVLVAAGDCCEAVHRSHELDRRVIRAIRIGGM